MTAEDPAREEEMVRRAAAVFDRSARGVLDLTSAKADVAVFLHGIFSSAVKALAPGSGQPSCFLSPKGKLIAAFHLHLLPGGTFRMVFPEPLREGAVKALGKYAFLGDVDITDRAPDLGILSVEGPLAAKVLHDAMGRGVDLPGALHEIRRIDLGGVAVDAVRAGESPEGGFDLWVPRESFDRARGRLLDAARRSGGGAAGPAAAETLRVEAGIPHHGKDHDDESFPNEVGWERALTYDKCYVGQEIVARIRTYGHANRKLVGLVFPGTEAPPRGATLRAGAEEAGNVTSPVFSTRLGRAIALAFLGRKFWDRERVDAALGETAVAVQVVELPIVRIDPRR
jgi:folate-binding protein YgfZ